MGEKANSAVFKNGGPKIWKRLLTNDIPQSPQIGLTDSLNNFLYSNIKQVSSWNPTNTVSDTHHGGIFNFGFSPDGSILVAACEKKSLLFFDPLNGKFISSKNKAHEDCVNYIKFLDTRTFATSSDDNTVAIWDTRYIKHRVRSLRGHNNWVKNIEYVSSEGLLVTSGFDGNVLVWDINKYEEESTYEKAFYTNGLMRTKITPAGDKLVVSTAGGYLIIIHNLDLINLKEDLKGFKPTLYRLMQMTGSPLGEALQSNHYFERKRNRIEFISDFPNEDEAEMIASLEMHPQGWCVVSRNNSEDENTEWTTVHDIQLNKESECEDSSSSSSLQSSQSASDSQNNFPIKSPDSDSFHLPHTDLGVKVWSRSPENQSRILERFTASSPLSSGVVNVPSTSGMSDNGRNVDNEAERCETLTEFGVDIDEDSSNDEESDSSENEPGSISSGDETGDISNLAFQDRDQAGSVLGLDDILTQLLGGSDSPILRLDGILHHKPLANKPHFIHKNRKRLTHYIEEPNVRKGFIKEICFSNDGRLICSPFASGVRLLGFNATCSDLSDCVPDTPVKLYEIATNLTHKNAVVSTRFSPVHCLLVTGCLNGQVDFHQPRFS